MSLYAESRAVLAWLLGDGELTEADAADRRAYLATAVSQWHLLRVGAEVVDRARHPFPGEPIRTVDAIHLASVLVARSAWLDSSCLAWTNGFAVPPRCSVFEFSRRSCRNLRSRTASFPSCPR